MKSDRRHELQQNELAQRLEVWVEAVKPYASWVVGGVIVGLLIALVITFQRGESQAERDANWNEFYTAEATNDTEMLKELAARHAGKPLGEITSLTLADYHLREGARQAQQNRSEAQKKFDEAISNYLSVADSARDPMLKNRALFGQAQALEWKMQLAKAREVYEQVEGPLKLQAQQRLATLRQPATAKFYDVYASHTPRPPVDPTRLSPNFEYSEEDTGDFDLLGPLDPNKFGPADGDGEDLLQDLAPLTDGLDPLGDGATEPLGDDASDPSADLEPATDDAVEDGASDDGSNGRLEAGGGRQEGAADEGASEDGSPDVEEEVELDDVDLD
ncbi:MAG: hypothetical protein WD030_02745, partial [Pirellulales bacterium]